MKTVLFALVLSACGKDACQEYATVACGKMALCVAPIERTACESESIAQMEAMDVTQDQCSSAKDKISGMNCTQFRAFITTATSR